MLDSFFLGNCQEYTIETETTGGILGIGEKTVTTVTHLNGNGADGTDTLTKIEILEFKDVAIPLAAAEPTCCIALFTILLLATCSMMPMVPAAASELSWLIWMQVLL